MKKKILIVSILILSFFINISGVKAATCNYRLPNIYIRKTTTSEGEPAYIRVAPYENEEFILTLTPSKKKKKVTINFTDFYNYAITPFDVTNKKLRENVDSGTCPKRIQMLSKLSADSSIVRNYGNNKIETLLNNSQFVDNRYISLSEIDKKTDPEFDSLGGKEDYYAVLFLYSVDNEKQQDEIDKFLGYSVGLWSEYVDWVYKRLNNYCGSNYKELLNADNYSKNLYDYSREGYSEGSLEPYDKQNNVNEACFRRRATAIATTDDAQKFLEYLDSNQEYLNQMNKYKDKYNKVHEFAYSPTVGKKQSDSLGEKANNTMNAKATEEKLEKDKCSALCISDATKPINGTALTECQKGTPYKNCAKALKKCKDEPNEDVCMRNEMGDEDYEKFAEKFDNLTKQIERTTLVKATVPALTVKLSPYKAKCEDVVIFHVFWVIIKVTAPILVILFGTGDLLMSVAAGDEQKIAKARKKLPKRIIAAVLIYILSVLIGIIVGFATNNNAKDTSLMYCIINGA